MLETTFDPTLMATNAILGSEVIFNEFVFELIGPADDRTASDADAAARFERAASVLGDAGLLRRHAPALQALRLLGLLRDVRWLEVVEVIQAAAEPKRGIGRRCTQ